MTAPAPDQLITVWRLLLGVLLAFMSFVSVAQAHAISFHMYPYSTGWSITQTENAIVHQSQTLRHYWNTPLVAWKSNGQVGVYVGTQFALYVDVEIPSGVPICNIALDHGVCGYHTRGYIVVEIRLQYPALDEKVISHEVMEYLADPNVNHSIHGKLVEVCDRVEENMYRAPNGTWLSDFVTPAYFRDSQGPYDYMHTLTHGHEYHHDG